MMVSAAATYNELLVDVDQLLLDPNNYRFQDSGDFVLASEAKIHERTVQARATSRLKQDSLVELKNSILANGFLAVERIVVRRYEVPGAAPGERDMYLVLEGNRRTAALKWIREDIDSGVDVPESVVNVLGALPVLVVDSDDSGIYLAIMGVRHVGGIKQWGGYQRAKLVAELKDSHGVETADIADRLGMSTREVNRRYRSLKALRQMEDDEEYGDYAKSTMYPLFHEAVASPDVRSWLGWNEGEGRFEDVGELRKFYDLIAPLPDEDDSSGDGPPQRREPRISTYSQVRELRQILPNEDAKRMLLDEGGSVSAALGLVESQRLSMTWKAQVSEASSSLQKMSAFELAEVSEEDFKVINDLEGVVARVLRMRAALKSEV